MAHRALLLFALASSTAQAGVLAYPVPWPRAVGGAQLMAVPTADAQVALYHLQGVPHGKVYDTPMPMSAPESFSPAPADVPITLPVPALSAMLPDDQDDFFLIVSDQPLTVSITDDERFQPGSPERVYFMPSTTGTARGRVFYGESNGGDAEEMIRVTNLGTTPNTAQFYLWSGTAWVQQGNVVVPVGTDATWKSPVEGTYKVVTSDDAFVIDGWLYDNATALARDISTGDVVGNVLYGYGGNYAIRAIDAVSYLVESRLPGTTSWTTVSTGTLAADGYAGGSLPLNTTTCTSTLGCEYYQRITLTGGVGWAVVGDPSLLGTTEWNGYFLPAQQEAEALYGTRFFTFGSARTVTVLPSAGTTVNVYDEDAGTLEDSYTSTGAWEFHNFFWPARARVEFSGGSGAALLVGTLNWGDCQESVYPGACGILEGSYTLPGTAIPCDGTLSAFFDCGGADAGAPVDAGAPADAGAAVDAGSAPVDAGPVRVTDAGGSQPILDAGPVPLNGVCDDPRCNDGHLKTRGCGCASTGATGGLVLALIVAGANGRRRKSPHRAAGRSGGRRG